MARIRDGADWIHVAEEWAQWLAFMNTEPSGLTNSETLTDQLSYYYILKQGSSPCGVLREE